MHRSKIMCVIIITNRTLTPIHMKGCAIFTQKTRIGGKHNYKRKLKFEEGELTALLPGTGY